jgi:AraC-like DNA-binding protein
MEYAISINALPHLRIIGRMKYQTGWQRSTRSRFNILFYMYSGEFLFELDSGEEVKLSEGCTLFIRAGTSYRVSCIRDCEYSYVHFSTDEDIAQKDELSDADDSTLIIPRLLELSSDGEGRERIVRRIGRLERSFSANERYSSLTARCETASLLILLAAVYENGCKETLPHALKLMCDYVRSNTAKTITLSDLCVLSGLSKQYVMMLFRKHLKMTATDYIHRTKLAYSAELLRQTDMTVDEIAYQLGYCGSYYFCRVFKKYYNATPTEYRRFASDGGEL